LISFVCLLYLFFNAIFDVYFHFIFFFFFKQKTAYEIVDCDWSSDVCSSDLITIDLPGHGKSQMVQAINFDHANQLILQTLQHRNIEQYVLIGYTMGARLADVPCGLYTF